MEPNPGSGSLTSGQYTTNYSYDALGNLLSMAQGGDGSHSVNRTFTYDMLSRPVTATSPESGTVCYGTSSGGNCTSGYDGNSNLLALTDARGVTTSITYDALNRPRSKTHSDGTPAVTLSYDEASPWGVTGNNNTVGRLSSTWIAGSLAGSIYIYDSMGRLTRNDQCAKSVCGSSSYGVFASYDYAGDLTSLTYPSGRKVVNNYSSAGALTKVNYDSYSGTGVNYPYYTVPQGSSGSPNTWGYWPNGAMRQFSFGQGVSETLSGNSRMQLNQITAGTSAQTLLSKTYSFYSSNNGNITQIADNMNNGRTQTFGYDYLNRLTSATTTASSGPDAWNESYSIDPWGNTKWSGTHSFTQNFSANNQIGPNQGYSYDAAGNLLTDTFHTYAYDAEERMTAVDTTNATYTYSADGTRSRKDIPGDYTEYVYFGGQTIAEKNSAGDWTDYIFANGQRIAKAEGLDNGLRNYGTTTGSGQWAVQYFGSAAGLNGYTIQSGDKLYLTQYQTTGSKGGVVLAFTDGSNSNWSVKDSDGNFLNDDQEQNATHIRTVDLSSVAGKTISAVAVNQEGDTALGSWAIIYEQISLVSADGSVHPIYTGQTSSPLSSNTQSGGETGIGSSIDVNRGHAIYPTQTTTYYTADHLGSSRLITSGNGYPVWSGVFMPYGQEWNPQITMNTYKFTGDEHDTESNLEHTQFRQYESTQGRWLTPDPYMGSMDLSNPQSMNRYAYVGGSPADFADPLGLDAAGNAPDVVYTCYSDGSCDFSVSGGSFANVGDGALPGGGGGLGGHVHYAMLLDSGGSGGGGGGGGNVQIPIKPLTKVNCQQLAAGQTPATDFHTWLAAYTNASLMFDQWLSGTGPVNRDFGPGTPQSQMMMSAYGLSKNVGNFLAGGASSGNQNFGLGGLVSSGLNPTTQFVGSYQWNMSLGGGNLNITLTNSTTAWSFLYHLPGLNPNPPNRFDSVLNPGPHPMGRVNQTFHIQVPCS